MRSNKRNVCDHASKAVLLLKEQNSNRGAEIEKGKFPGDRALGKVGGRETSKQFYIVLCNVKFRNQKRRSSSRRER